MQSNEDGGAARPADDPSLEVHVTAIMEAVAIADSPGQLREYIRARLATLLEAEAGTQVSCEALAERVRKLMLSGDLDHTATDEGPKPSDSWVGLGSVTVLVHRAQLLENLSYSAASLVAVLQSRPWLASFKVEVRSEVFMGDEGGFGTSYSMHVDNLVVRAGANEAIPEDLQDESGLLDIPEAASELYMELLNDVPWFAEALDLSSHTDEEITIVVDRCSLEDILEASAVSGRPISGSAVARRLWPEKMARVLDDPVVEPTTTT